MKSDWHDPLVPHRVHVDQVSLGHCQWDDEAARVRGQLVEAEGGGRVDRTCEAKLVTLPLGIVRAYGYLK